MHARISSFKIKYIKEKNNQKRQEARKSAFSAVQSQSQRNIVLRQSRGGLP